MRDKLGAIIALVITVAIVAGVFFLVRLVSPIAAFVAALITVLIVSSFLPGMLRSLGRRMRPVELNPGYEVDDEIPDDEESDGEEPDDEDKAPEDEG